MTRTYSQELNVLLTYRGPVTLHDKINMTTIKKNNSDIIARTYNVMTNLRFLPDMENSGCHNFTDFENN